MIPKVIRSKNNLRSFYSIPIGGFFSIYDGDKPHLMQKIRQKNNDIIAVYQEGLDIGKCVHINDDRQVGTEEVEITVK